MKTYTVKEIANLLNTNQETVRRWIRSGKLKSTIDSRREGNVVTESMLQAFLKTSPKYASAVVATLTSPIGLGLVTATMIGGVLVDKQIKIEQVKNASVEKEELIRVLKKEIAERTEDVKQKRSTIEKLSKEIDESTRRIGEIQMIINDLSQPDQTDKRD